MNYFDLFESIARGFSESQTIATDQMANQISMVAEEHNYWLAFK